MLDPFNAAFAAVVPVQDAFEAAFAAPNLQNPVQTPSPNPPVITAPGWDIETWLDTHGYWLRKRHPVGHETYPLGLWSISALKRQGGYTVEGELIRYCDESQLQEMNQVLHAGLLRELDDLVNAMGVKEGPVRSSDKPRIDPKGNPIVEVNNGNHGPLPAECAWIEAHDPVYVQYMGTDDNWPNGCFAIEAADRETQYFDQNGIIHIAHEILGMPYQMFKANGWVNKLAERQQQNLDLPEDEDIDPFEAAFQMSQKTQTALAKVGINALIDEATGYQDDRGENELRDMYASYTNSTPMFDLWNAFGGPKLLAPALDEPTDFDKAFE